MQHSYHAVKKLTHVKDTWAQTVFTESSWHLHCINGLLEVDKVKSKVKNGTSFKCCTF